MDLLGPEAWKYRDELEEVKSRLGITHDKFDCWLFKFLENKHYDVDETVAKLQRRFDMERGFLQYEITDFLRDSMRSGIMQIIGEDKEGRVAMYVVTRRDFPKAKLREQRRQNFDMWLSYGTRLRRTDPRCRITLLVNQKDAGVWANTDMTFQTNIAFRIAKFYPGMIDRAYVCCMSNGLSAVARPIIKAMPSAISDRIFIYNEKQVMEEGKLLEFFDKSVLPVALGGDNDCDKESNWHSFADNVETYFTALKDAISRGMSVKEYEQSVIDEEERVLQARKREEDRLAKEQRTASVRNLSIALQQAAGAAGSAGGATAAAAAGGAAAGAAAAAEGHPLMMTTQQAVRRRRAAAPPALHHSRSASMSFHRDPDTMTVFTCESESAPPPVDAGMYTHDDELSVSAQFSHPAHRNCFRKPGGFALAPENIRRHLQIVESLCRMEEQEALFRESFYHQHEQYLQEFSKLLMSARTNVFEPRMDVDDDTGELRGDNTGQLAMRCPRPARSVTRGVLLTICVAVAIFMLGATVFALLSGSTIIVVMFIAIFIDSIHLYPLGLALIILGHQCGLVGSRGFELCVSTLKGQLARPLSTCRRKACALMGQFAFQVIVCVIAFVTFVAFTSVDHPITGLRVGLGSGMYSCAIALALYHLLFPFGLSPEPRRHKNHAGLTLYLFFDIYESETKSDNNSRQTSAIVVVSFPVVVAVLFGVCFMVSPSLYFVIATVATTLAAAFTVNHFVGGTYTNITGNILRATTWISCVYWITLTFTVGFVDWAPQWQDSVIGSSAVVAYFGFVTWLCYVFKENTPYHRYAFRVAYASCLLLCLTGVALMFYVAWAFGLVIAILMMHSFFCFLRPSSTAMIGTLVTVFATLLIAVTIVLYAFQMTTFADSSATSDVTLRYVPESELPHPICLQTWGSESGRFRVPPTSPAAELAQDSYAASDLALLNRLSLHRNRTAIEMGLAVAFPELRITDVVETIERVAVMVAYRHIRTNTTILSIVPATDRMGAMSGITMWAEGIGLQPYASVLPRNWTAAIVDAVSFLTTQFPLTWKGALRTFNGYARSAIMSTPGGTSKVLLTGHALGGGIASVLAAQLSIAAVAFESPGVLLSRNKFDVTEWQYLKFVTVVNSQATLLGGIDDHGTALQSIRCPYDIVKCSRPATTFCSLQSVCGSVANRSLVPCDPPTEQTTEVVLPPPTATAGRR